MVFDTLLYCVAIGIMMVGAPYVMFSRSAVKEYVTSGKMKKINKILIFVFLYFITWFGISKIPNIVNQLYEIRVGTVGEITGESSPGGLLDIKLQKYMKHSNVIMYSVSLKQFRIDMNGVYAENLKKDDEIEIKEFLTKSIVVKKNGKETDFYKKYYKEWLGNPVWCRIFFTLTALINMILHLRKFGYGRKRNLGCTAFIIVLLVCIWKPIYTKQEAVYWGYFLTVLFIGYQIADFIYHLKDSEYINIPYPQEKRKYVKIADREKMHILTQQKKIDYFCPNCGGKMTISEDHIHKKCHFCGSVIALSQTELEDAREILYVLNIPKADCVEIVKKICMEYQPKGELCYLAGESLTKTETDVCKKVREYFKIPVKEDIFFIYDTSIVSSWKYGFAICTSGIYFRKGWFTKPGKYSWKEFKKIQIFAKDGMLNMGRILFYETECRSLGKMLQKIQNEI